MASGLTSFEVVERLPRIRGGGPSPRLNSLRCSRSSPHTRGWSQRAGGAPRHPSVFPAYAGVVPCRIGVFRHCDCLPRIRGGGPSDVRVGIDRLRSSPHTRGWSHPRGVQGACRAVFPAYAGVVRIFDLINTPSRSLPRIRGGGPGTPTNPEHRQASSPHTRGWSQRRPARAHRQQVFPAYAGVVPRMVVPLRSVASLPRIRGGGPCRANGKRDAGQSSPHTRGWSLGAEELADGAWVFPAYAGVVPQGRGLLLPRFGLPRIRGGGPVTVWLREFSLVSSPHTRGWSLEKAYREAAAAVFPAYAGVVPPSTTRTSSSRGLPRIRGGGPRKYGLP